MLHVNQPWVSDNGGFMVTTKLEPKSKSTWQSDFPDIYFYLKTQHSLPLK